MAHPAAVRGREDAGPVRIAITARQDQVDRERVVAVLSDWYAKNQRPPTQQEWDASGDVPFSARTVRRRWGWRPVLRQVLETRQPHAGQPGLEWSDHEMVQALVAAYQRDGAWPSGASWMQAASGHPSSRTYVRRFGSWSNGVEAAREASRMGRRP